MSPDILVIGAGPAGLTAALAAVRFGATARVIAKGIGTTHWAGGWIDVMGYRPSGEVVQNPIDAVRILADAQPAHPYALAGASSLEHAITLFRQAMEVEDLPYEGSLDQNTLVPTPAGARRPTCLIPTAMQAGADLDGRTLICALAGMRDMYGGYAAANLRAAGFDVKAVTVEIDAFRARRPQTTVVAARMLEDPDFQRQLIGSVRPHAPGAVRIGFPAVLGVERHREVVRTLAEGLGAPVFEISTLPPSVPGLRMFEALRRRLLGMKVQVEIGAEVTERVTDGDRLVAVGTVSASRLRYYRAGAVVLATGGILGGGLSGRRDGTVTEVALGLPVRAPERGEWFHARVFDGHPIFRAGIQVNEHMQPVNADGQVVLRNVYAAGAILAGSDPWREKSHEGIALATGYRAVESAVNALSPATRASPR